MSLWNLVGVILSFRVHKMTGLRYEIFWKSECIGFSGAVVVVVQYEGPQLMQGRLVNQLVQLPP